MEFCAQSSTGQNMQPRTGVSPSALLWQWHYIDPQGETQGPFMLFHMIHWKRLGFFNNEGFRVWKTGQTSEQAILLRDAFLLHL